MFLVSRWYLRTCFVYTATLLQGTLANCPTVGRHIREVVIHIFTHPCSSTGIELSKSSIKIPSSKGDMTDPCGTPAGQVCIVESTPGSLTCCVLPWRKLCIHCYKDLSMFLPLSLDKRMEWSTRSKALLKSINKEWMAFFPSVVLSESFNHVCVMFTRADAVERPWEKACWFSLTLKASLFSIICTLSRTLRRTGKTDICLKSVWRSSGRWTLGTGLTRAYLYKVRYFLSRILVQMISRLGNIKNLDK